MKHYKLTLITALFTCLPFLIYVFGSMLLWLVADIQPIWDKVVLSLPVIIMGALTTLVIGYFAGEIEI